MEIDVKSIISIDHSPLFLFSIEVIAVAASLRLSFYYSNFLFDEFNEII